MTKNAPVHTPTFYMLPAGSDPRLPSGIWVVSQTNTGDASGGAHNFTIELAATSHPLNLSMMFVMDSFSFQAGNGDTEVALETDGLSLNPFNLTSDTVQYRTVGAIAGPVGTTSQNIPRDTALPWTLGYPQNASFARVYVAFTNGNGVNNIIRGVGTFFLAEAAFLPQGPAVSEEARASIDDAQSPNYPVGKDAYYAKLRRGEQPSVRRQAQRIIATVPQVHRGQASVHATDQQLVDEILAEESNTGAPIRTAINRVLGLSASQVVQQLTTPPRPGQTPPPGRRYANLTGRTEEGNGGII